jgi:hypothetical protein
MGAAIEWAKETGGHDVHFDLALHCKIIYAAKAGELDCVTTQ